MTRQELHQLRDQNVITNRECEILTHRLKHSQYVVARGLGISRSTVRSLEQNALDKIARHIQEDAA